MIAKQYYMPASSIEDPISCVIDDEHRGILYNALSKLSQHEAVSVEKHFAEHLSFRQIGREIGKSHEYVRICASRGLIKLRIILNGACDFLAETRLKNPDAYYRKHENITFLAPRASRRTITPRIKRVLSEEERKERQRFLKRQHYLNNIDEIKKRRRKYYEENYNSVRCWTQRWIDENIERHKEYQKQYQKQYQRRYTQNLADGYVRTLLTQDGLRSRDIPQELIGIKRQLLVVKRLLKKGQKPNDNNRR